MQKSDSIGELAKALCKAQSEIKTAAKDSTNPHFKSSYADLTSIFEACRPALTSNGLAIVQTTRCDESVAVVVQTMLIHTSGEWILGELPMNPAKTDPQSIGSAITYGKRYGLAAMVGVTSDDDDANAASSHNAPQQQQQRQPPRPNTAQNPRPSSSPAKNETPERAALIKKVQNICKQLNDADDSIVWKAETLNRFIDRELQTTGGMDALGGESFGELIEKLSARLPRADAR